MKFTKILFVVFGSFLFLISAFALFEPGFSPIGCFICMDQLVIINNMNDNAIGSDLEVNFIAKGKGDLVIENLEGNIEFVKLKCGGEVLDCNNNGALIVKILSKKVILEFEFENQKQIVQNII